VPPLVAVPHPGWGQAGARAGGAGAQRAALPTAFCRALGMSSCVKTELSESYLKMCCVLRSTIGSKTLAVYQPDVAPEAGGSSHQMAILFPYLRARASRGARGVFPVSILLSRFHAACVRCHKYAVGRGLSVCVLLFFGLVIFTGGGLSTATASPSPVCTLPADGRPTATASAGGFSLRRPGAGAGRCSPRRSRLGWARLGVGAGGRARAGAS
jgi:hypothetical protein